MKQELTPLEKIEAVYNMEINAKIDWFFDRGFNVELGDKINGWRESMDFNSLEEAADWLYLQAIKKIVNHT